MAFQNATLSGPGTITAQSIESVTRDLGLSREEVAAILAAPAKMLDRWSAGLIAPGPASADRLNRLSAVRDRLCATFKPHDILWWLRSPNDDIGRRQPVQFLLAGEFHRVEAALDMMDRRTTRW